MHDRCINNVIFAWLVLALQLFPGMIRAQESYPFRNPALPTADRISDLAGRLTLEEEASMMLYNSPEIPRLGIPAYNWWSECLHGVARNGVATVFPQAIGLAATFDTALVRKVASAISDEARAKHREALINNLRNQYAGLSFWTPNINIFRDPRWGRGQETYGEDPYLTGSMGVAFVSGLQGNDPRYLKTAACAKHFAVHSGPEPDRHKFNAIVDEKDLRETYLPAFKMLSDAGVEAVMCAYNRVNGEPCCGSGMLLDEILRKEWGFRGHIVTDCWALDDIWARHQVVATREEAAAMAVKAGVNLNCGYIYKYIPAAVNQGLIDKKDVDRDLTPLLNTAFRLGLYDPDSLVPWTRIPAGVVHCENNVALAREAAVRSIVLVKNKNNVLPLQKDLTSLFITGPNAAEVSVLLGNYNGISGDLVTILEGVMGKLGPAVKVEYVKGTDLVKPVYDGWFLAGSSAATIAVMGISPLLEGEEGDALLSDANGDRRGISLPENQVEYLKRLRGTHDHPIILVITGGGPVSLTEVEDLADAILYAWYPGEQGGNAVADVIFGDASPSGRLPVTIYKSAADLPPFSDYTMRGRTYRYFRGVPEFSFGTGLTYGTFEYSDLKVPLRSVGQGDTVEVRFRLANTGRMDATEMPQLYYRYAGGDERDPARSLLRFRPVDLKVNEQKEVVLRFCADEMHSWDMSGHRWTLRPGDYELMIGPSSSDSRLNQTIKIK